jgi:hypothetical protein
MALNINNPAVEPPAMELARMTYELQVLTRSLVLRTGKDFPLTDAACV